MSTAWRSPAKLLIGGGRPLNQDHERQGATISFVGGGAMLKLLSTAEQESNKDYTSRLVSSQVVPSYNDDSVPAVREYRDAMDRYRDGIMLPDSLLYPHGKTAEWEYAPLP